MIPPHFACRLSACLLFALLLTQRIIAADNFARSEEKQIVAAEPSSPPSWYGEGVRPTEPRAPDVEQAGFHLPAGFEIRLFASEPEIAKPMNLAFDHRGRLWVTNSFEYPYPVRDGSTPTDSVRILEDTDRDGRADRSIVFADGLNIPIGVLPYGKGCLCFSIPNIYYLRDTDGDDICDQRDLILGPFDTTRDTHGMINSMRMGDDGWVYANHGFNNQSTISGSDGHEIVMHSGNTFRFRPDGSRVEHVTWGQVNPFGRTSDDWGSDFTADCHSKPIYQLVRGGQYPGFGRTDDGLGMVPPMMSHLHGSTAISGLVFLSDQLGTPSLANQMLSGNVMTSRINRNEVIYRGATAIARELPDFLTCDDPWFRPVDIRLGPDGNLYVADFYNRIIGHYEVPLDHPGRDRFRGRIWQIRSLEGSERAASAPLDEQSIEQSWNAANPTVRRLALQHAAAHPRESLDERAREIVITSREGTANARITAMWYLHQRGLVKIDLLEQVLNDPSPVVRTHGCRVISAILHDRNFRTVIANDDPLVNLAVTKLVDENAHVQCAAADALGQTTRVEAIAPLLDLLARVNPNDPILRQTIRIALRDIAQSQAHRDATLIAFTETLPHSQQRLFAEILLAVPTPLAAECLMSFLLHETPHSRESAQMMQHIIAHAHQERLGAVIDLARHLSMGQPLLQQSLADALVDACGQRGVAVPTRLRLWIDEQIETELERLIAALREGHPLSITWHDVRGNPWPLQSRQDDTGHPLSVMSSFPLGESYTGQLISSPFTCPPKISFRIAGHNRPPGAADSQLNRLELVDARTEQVLQTAFPPRSDAAVAVQWNCESAEGARVFLRCTDGDAGAAYAWIAFGDLVPTWLAGTDESLGQILATVTRNRMIDRRPELIELLGLLNDDSSARARVAMTIAELDQRTSLARLLRYASEMEIDQALVDEWTARAVDGRSINETNQTALLAKVLTSAQQTVLAVFLVSETETVPLLIELIQDGAIAPEVLLEKTVWDPMQTTASASLISQAEQLRAKAKPTDTEMEQAIVRIGERVGNSPGSIELGRTLFLKHCAVCHQLAGQGELVGPQLDGVGSRSVQRLLEDIVVPDRNVDKAFRTSTFLTQDGSVINGLVRDENESRILVAGPDGKTRELPREQIELRRDAATSLMPSNLQQLVGDDAVADIVLYLQHAASQK